MEVKSELVVAERFARDALSGMKVETFKVEPAPSESHDEDREAGSSSPSASSLSNSKLSEPSRLESSHDGSPVAIKEELDPIYVCDECGMSLDGEEELKEHVVNTHLPMGRKKGLGTSDSNGHPSANLPDDDLTTVCENCGRQFDSAKEFKKHFKAEHFVVEETRVEEALELPSTVSQALREKIELLVKLVTIQRRQDPSFLARRGRGNRWSKGLTDPMIRLLKDIGVLIKREVPSQTAGASVRMRNEEHRKILTYLALQLQCSMHNLRPYITGRWNNPLQFNQADIQAMKERFKRQVASAMPDVIANHNAKAKRMSGRQIATVKTFNWTMSLKQCFKDLVNMYLQNFRLDVDVRSDADEKELKASVEAYLKQFFKSVVRNWPAGWMSERVLLGECRSLIREFLGVLKEKQISDSGDSIVVLDVDASNLDYSNLITNDDNTSLSSVTGDNNSPSPSQHTLLYRASTEDNSLQMGNSRFIWTKRVVRLIRHGRGTKRMYVEELNQATENDTKSSPTVEKKLAFDSPSLRDF